MNSKKYFKKIITTNITLIVISIVMSIIQAIATVVMSLISKKLIDEKINNLLLNSILLVSVIVILIISYCLNYYFQTKLNSKMEYNLRTDLYRDIFDKDYYVISKIHSGELMNYLTSDISVIASNASSLLPNLVLMITKLILAFVVLVFLEIKLAIFLLIIGIIGFILSLGCRKQMKKLHKTVQNADGIARSFMQESIESTLVIKSFNGEKIIDQKNKQLENNLYNAKMKRAKFSVSINGILNLVFQGTYVITLVWAIYSIANNNMGYGTLVALIQLISQVQTPMMNLSGILPRYYQMMASIERILEIKKIVSDSSNDDNNYEINDFEQIIFENFSFSYDNVNVIENSNFEINNGDFILIKGISGIGKSTLLKLLLGILYPKKGCAYLKNGDEKFALGKQTRKLFSYVPQGNFIFSGTIKENLCFFNPNVSVDEINQALKIANADGFVNNLEKGMNTILGEKGIGLSEGQIQRLAIARAILSKRKILLLDEATSALDKDSELSVLKNLKQLNDITCIIVTHKDASKEICNRELIFDGSNIHLQELI